MRRKTDPFNLDRTRARSSRFTSTLIAAAASARSRTALVRAPFTTLRDSAGLLLQPAGLRLP